LISKNLTQKEKTNTLQELGEKRKPSFQLPIFLGESQNPLVGNEPKPTVSPAQSPPPISLHWIFYDQPTFLTSHRPFFCERARVPFLNCYQAKSANPLNELKISFVCLLNMLGIVVCFSSLC
jgi:hypothetical protein